MSTTETRLAVLYEAIPAAEFPARWVALERAGYRLTGRAWDACTQRWCCTFARRGMRKGVW